MDGLPRHTDHEVSGEEKETADRSAAVFRGQTETPVNLGTNCPKRGYEVPLRQLT